jgi:predicted RNase H-like nuclease
VGSLTFESPFPSTSSELLTTRFIGLDLAWSERNSSAAVVLEAETDQARWIGHHDRLGDDQEVVSFIRQAADHGPAIVAIDAPLLVPNETGSRPVDRLISRLFGPFEAGCYPANRKRFANCPRGENIVASLAADAFVQDPYLRQQAPTRTVFEVYPHPAMLSLFGLEKTLKYKARAHRSLAYRRAEMGKLQAHLASLQQHRPAMSLPQPIANRDLHTLRGSSLKQYEDLLDAAVCAYVAYYAWYWGPEGYQVYGDTTLGYILVPMTDWIRQLLARHPTRPA